MTVDSYEYVGLAVPGSVLVFVLTLLSPDVRSVVAGGGLDLGGFGVFLLLSFVAGYLVQALGNGLERVESVLGVDVSGQMLRGREIVSHSQRLRLEACLREDGHTGAGTMTPAGWSATRAEMAAAVRRSGAAHRLDTFLRMYGLGRGLTAAFLLSLPVTLLFPRDGEIRLRYLAVLSVCALLAYLRTRQFSVHYVRELVIAYVAENSRLPRPGTATAPATAGGGRSSEPA